MKIVSSLFGDKYVSLLLVFLESIYQNYEVDTQEIYIFYSDIDEVLLDPIKIAYKKVVFIQFDAISKIDNSSTSNYFSSLKSGKMAYLNKIYDFLEEDEKFLLIDCDTIVLKDLSRIFKGDYDIAFTPLPNDVSTYPMNSGVLFFKNSGETRSVTENMQKHVSEILENKKLHEESVSKYGGADQAAFCRVIGYESDNIIQDSLRVLNVKTIELDWEKFNNFSSVESFDNISILHLKGSWQTIIFRGRSLQSIKNKKEKALKVYLLYLKLLTDAISRTYSYVEIEKNEKKLGVKIPFFIHLYNDELQITKWKFYLFQYPERIYRYFINRKYIYLSKFFERLIFKSPKRIYKHD